MYLKIFAFAWVIKKSKKHDRTDIVYIVVSGLRDPLTVFPLALKRIQMGN